MKLSEVVMLVIFIVILMSAAGMPSLPWVVNNPSMGDIIDVLHAFGRAFAG